MGRHPSGDRRHDQYARRYQPRLHRCPLAGRLSFGIFFGLGLGAAVHDGEIGGPGSDPDKKWLGSRVLFHIPLEVGYHLDAHNDVSVYFEHTSNAYTEKFNEGLDRIGVRYGYRF